MAAAGRISSEFNRLRDASWLSTGYTLGLCAAQPMVSELTRETLEEYLIQDSTAN